MGLFDEIVCNMPLPDKPEWVADGHVFQTKSFDPRQEMYEIRSDGTLWMERYEIEDHSDPNATGLMRFAGMATRVNKRFERLADFDGAVCFYDSGPNGAWVEFKAVFVDGVVVKLVNVSEPPEEEAGDFEGENY